MPPDTPSPNPRRRPVNEDRTTLPSSDPGESSESGRVEIVKRDTAFCAAMYQAMARGDETLKFPAEKTKETVAKSTN